MFPSILQRLLNTLYPIKAQTVHEQKEANKNFLKQISKEADEQKISLEQKQYLEKLLDADAKIALDTPSSRYTTYPTFNPNVYQAIFPYLKLAHLFEQAGAPEEHAGKLACVFDNAKEALAYLNKFCNPNSEQKQTIVHRNKYFKKSTGIHPVHDACLFNLPESSDKDRINQWLKIARKKDSLLKPDFLAAFYHTNAVAVKMAEDKKNISTLLKEVYKPDPIQLDHKKILEEINKKIQINKKFCKKFERGSLARSSENVEENRQKMLELDQLYHDRYVISLTKDFSYYDFDDVLDAHKVFQSKQYASRTIFIKSGIAEEYYQEFLSLDRQRAGANIPAITVDCGNGFYIRKLSVKDDVDGALGACLGKLCGGCQSIDRASTMGAGVDMTLHGLTHPDSGFYVLFKGDATKPHAGDEIWGKVLASRTPSGAILFNSIQSKQKSEASMIIAAFGKLANALVKDADVPLVSVGVGSGLRSEDIYCHYLFTAEEPKNYNGHHDAKRQVIMADKRLLFDMSDCKNITFDEKSLAEEVKNLKNITELSSRMKYSLGFMSIQSPKIKKTWEDKFSKVLDKDKMSIVKIYLDVQAQFIKLQNKIENAVDEDIEEITQKLIGFIKTQPVDIEVRPKPNSYLLMTAIQKQQVELVKILLDAKISVNIQDQNKVTPLMLAIESQQIEVVEKLLKAGADTNSQDIIGQTPLIYAIISNNVAIVRLLLAFKADRNFNRLGKSLVDIARFHGYQKIAEVLQEASATAIAPVVPLSTAEYGIFSPGKSRQTLATHSTLQKTIG